MLTQVTVTLTLPDGGYRWKGPTRGSGEEESTCSVDPLPPAYTGYSEGKHELPLNPNHPDSAPNSPIP